jgi:hypothetical protein
MRLLERINRLTEDALFCLACTRDYLGYQCIPIALSMGGGVGVDVLWGLIFAVNVHV